MSEIKIKVGDTIPEGTFSTVLWTPALKDGSACGTPSKINTNEWKGKKVVLFSVPGAFTPTCHVNHLPAYIKRHDEFKAKGVDVVACIAANDPFVLSGWGRVENAEDKVLFLTDTNAEWSKELGLDVDLSGHGLGIRTSRYLLIIDDLVVKHVALEPNPGAVAVSGAENALENL
ncbi:hypothetical protein CTheo_7734 [Ceratobasidium theobromae]|uniref:Putative peroxiredoxin n=1 Tax=Ceratobasidium theobromae TaxID=1582974 RepID=A0A5N5QAY6_9AGAM|nr:hypothetical protein CTheo_7734 [Ceratobasidium theobromae]